MRNVHADNGLRINVHLITENLNDLIETKINRNIWQCDLVIQWMP